jgi:hypothetical protein
VGRYRPPILHIHLQRIDTFSSLLPLRYVLYFPEKKSVPELNDQPTYLCSAGCFGVYSGEGLKTSGKGREVRTCFLREAMGCYLTECRARVGSWAARFSHVLKTSQRVAEKQERGEVIVCLGTMILSAATIAMLLVIGGVETNPGPVGETEKIMRVLCSGCDKILNSGTQCDTCGRWFHNSCGNVKVRVAESGKWACDKRRTET